MAAFCRINRCWPHSAVSPCRPCDLQLVAIAHCMLHWLAVWSTYAAIVFCFCFRAEGIYLCAEGIYPLSPLTQLFFCVSVLCWSMLCTALQTISKPPKPVFYALHIPPNPLKTSKPNVFVYCLFCCPVQKVYTDVCAEGIYIFRQSKVARETAAAREILRRKDARLGTSTANWKKRKSKQ